ncbi:MAG TPA: PaaI family thioesterase [Steroidobacteraceae bacterium]|jgi:acyl-coenzyme A thioesterase PaaI-like protein|nr:PaaI family thioesterase [Steroidobacteraceae bacterium]
MNADDPQLATLRARAQAIPLDEPARLEWARQFNRLPGLTHFGLAVDLADPLLVRVTLASIEEHHVGGLRSRAVHGGVLAGIFDCALGVAGTLQFDARRAGTCELSLKFMRAVLEAPLEVFGACIKRTDNLAFAESALYSNGKLCAIATGIVAVAADRGAQAIW